MRAQYRCLCLGQPASPEEFSAQAVAERVHSARKTADTQRREILRLMTSYTAEQRQRISIAYENLYDQVSERDCETTGYGGNRC